MTLSSEFFSKILKILTKIFSATNQQISLAVTFLPSLFLLGGVISSKILRVWGSRVLGVLGGLLVSRD